MDKPQLLVTLFLAATLGFRDGVLNSANRDDISVASESSSQQCDCPVIKRLEICIDVNDVDAQAAFWALALDYRRGTGDGNPYLNLFSHSGDGPVVFLQRVPDAKSTKNRLHIDIRLDEPQQHVEKLVAAGATRMGEAGTDGTGWWQVLADPEGNEFCVAKNVPIS